MDLFFHILPHLFSDLFREFYALAGLDGMLVQKTFGTICGMSIFSLSFLIEHKDISYRYYFLIFPHHVVRVHDKVVQEI